MFLGLESPIVALVLASYEGAEAVASVCADGTVTLWDAHDGHSHGTAPQLTAECQPRSAALLADGRHLVVAGDAPFVQLVDLWAVAVRSLPISHSPPHSGAPC